MEAVDDDECEGRQIKQQASAMSPTESNSPLQNEIAYSNPEPPPDLNEAQLINADNIGDTVFSKQWLFTTLMTLIQTVEDQAKKVADGTSQEDSGFDLDEKLQDDLCQLWDMSMNQEVVKFLAEFEALDILSGVIAKSRLPRATEICVGILGNMACDADVCQQMARKSKLVDLLLALLASPDARTLVELTRLLHTCVSCSQPGGSTWLRHLEQASGLFTNLSFILQSSTNNDLLLNTADFLDKLMDMSEVTTHAWSGAELVLCCLEAVRQVGGDSGVENIDVFLHILQLLSTCQPGAEALLSYSEDLWVLCRRFLTHVCADELVAMESREHTVASALSVVNVLLAGAEDRNKYVHEDFELVRCLLKILEDVLPAHAPRHSRTLRRMRSHSEASASPPHPEETPQKTQSSSESGPHTFITRDSESFGARDLDSVQLNDKEDDLTNFVVDTPQSVQTPDLTNGASEKIRANGRLGGSHLSCDNISVSSSNEELKQSFPQSQNTRQVYQMLYDVLQSCVVEVVTVLNRILSSTSALQEPSGQEESVPALGVPECLDYLDTHCPSLRLHYFIYCLKQASLAEENKDLVHTFVTITKTYKLNRIERVTNRVLNQLDS